MPTLPGPTVITGGGGSGFEIGSSYLQAHTGGNSSIASGVIDVETFSLADSDGTDFAIDGGDNTKINVAVDCWAITWYLAEAAPDSGSLTRYEASITSTPNVPPLLNTPTRLAATITAVGAYLPVSNPPIFIPAGTVLGATIMCETSGGTWTNLGGNYGFHIVRVA